MDFLKKHYEKITLSVVMLGVTVAALVLTLNVGRVQQDLQDQLSSIAARKPKEFRPVDLSTNEMTLARLAEGVSLELDGPHNTFNPGTWERTAGQMRRKAGRGWVDLLQIAEIKPLRLIVEFSGVAGLEDSPRYQFTVTREHEAQASKRRPTMTSLTPGAKNDLFLLREVKGSPTAPTELVCEMLEGSQRVVITPDQPHVAVMAYAADLRYDGRDLRDRRVDDSLNLSGATYKIVAIGKDELVVSAPNQVRTTIRP